MKRRIESLVAEDLKTKMVLLAGPRQCGKTTVAENLILQFRDNGEGHYYNWDDERDRKSILANRFDPDSKLWVFDEVHKYRFWRNWLKGLYDKKRKEHSILVTGSAQLDYFSRGGDSLQGRYFLHRLHPLTFSEILGLPFADEGDSFLSMKCKIPRSAQSTLTQLMKRGGFPEPFLAHSDRQADRWRLGYSTRLVREEVQSLNWVRDLDRLELLYDRLPECVGAPLSINSLREDLQVAHETVADWISVFERLYSVFRLPPFGAPKIKAVKKEQKLYLWDWSRVAESAPRFENLIALHLLRLTHWFQDVRGQKVELRYFRDRVGHEVDFIMTKDQKPWFIVEVKQSDRPVDSNLRYFLERIKVPYAFQVSLEGVEDYDADPINGCKIRVLPATRFLANLP